MVLDQIQIPMSICKGDCLRVDQYEISDSFAGFLRGRERENVDSKFWDAYRVPWSDDDCFLKRLGYQRLRAATVWESGSFLQC